MREATGGRRYAGVYENKKKLKNLENSFIHIHKYAEHLLINTEDD